MVDALNRGLAAARAPLIARLDADDLCLPERLAAQRRYLDAHPEVGLVACRVRFGGDARRGAGYARHVDWTNGLLTHEAIALARFVESPLAHPSVMFRRERARALRGLPGGRLPRGLRAVAAVARGRRADGEAAGGAPRLAGQPRPALAPRSPLRARGLPPREGRLSRPLAGPSTTRSIRASSSGARDASPAAARGICKPTGVEIAATSTSTRARSAGPSRGGPSSIPPPSPPPGTCFVVAAVASAGAREQIERALIAAGYRAGRDYVLAA